MLQLGLTGGIGAGKSTVAARLRDHGAVVVDADRISREVVEPGTPGLRALVGEFGAGVLDATGRALDRGALAGLVFGHPDRLEALGAIVHPLVARRTAELVAVAGPDRIVVHDVPLVVENGMAPRYHLVAVVVASEDERVRRLVGERGMDADDARARIAAQADDAARRAVADLWWDNEAADRTVLDRVDRDWAERLVPYDENLRAGRPAGREGAVRLVSDAEDGERTARAARLVARLTRLCPGARAEHVGAGAVPGVPAPVATEVLLAVPAGTPDWPGALRVGGFVADDPISGFGGASSGGRPPAGFLGVRHGADPGAPAEVVVVHAGSPAERLALDRRDWLRADPDARADHVRLLAGLAARGVPVRDWHAAQEPWWASTAERLRRWARAHGRPGAVAATE